jgi:hypothetical protein
MSGSKLTDSEKKMRLAALVAELERLRREAKRIESDMLAFLIGYAEEEAQREITRLTVAR